MVTPLTKKQTINQEVTQNLTHNLIDSGVNGIFVLGTNGEFHVLNEAEKLKVTEIVVKEVNGRVPVVTGVGGIQTEAVINLSLQMEKVGADILSIITPYFVSPSQTELFEHYKKIAEETNLPILLYNIPAKTGVHLEVETVKELAKLPSIIGIKDSSGDFNNIQSYIDATAEEKFSVLAGTDSLILKTLQAGGTGAVAATANVIPEHVVSIYQKWLSGDINEAEKFQEKLKPLREAFKYGTLPSVLKKAIELQGVEVGPPRLPVKEIEGNALEEVKKMMSTYL